MKKIITCPAIPFMKIWFLGRSNIRQVMLFSGVLELNAVMPEHSTMFHPAWREKKCLLSSGSPCLYGNFSDGGVWQIV